MNSCNGKKIGISFGNRVSIEELPGALKLAAKYDIDCIELTPELGPVLIGGSLNLKVLKTIKSILSDFPFGYTVHCPGMQNMRDLNNLEMQHDIFRAGLDFTKEIGGMVYVAHFSQKSEDESVEKVFEEGMAKMADYAGKVGVVIGVENIEIERVEPVLSLIRRINHKNLQMTFDFAHSFLASKYYGYDFMESVKQAKPYIKHVHIHDNIGLYDPDRLVNKQRSLKERLTVGRGDLHLPIGWGLIPYDKVFDVLKDSYNGVYMLENDVGQNEMFIEDTLKTLKELIY
ncbi:MAG: sugar phosphate isomerase/epimerase [Firmicutes bacterium]|nr:sugar phosphate isomerase/epimerase [Bacillota bacterium]